MRGCEVLADRKVLRLPSSGRNGVYAYKPRSRRMRR
ncbi:hypothetical protein EDC25_12526 [Pseudofulvimonas gallinarii]|jgi:hypothetical protein|uniref:Uncharacterized protein n=1 Tax=Pseudofulvimonas gallinarii TaxID=634155 RepID=A0A4R3L2B1_9GAMM|nr:hypothetical protein EDC25_12526 [Pseudofulvimonas gallinarii]